VAGTAEPEDRAATALPRRDPGEAEIVLPEVEMYAPQPGLTGETGMVAAGTTEPEDRAATALPRRDPGEAGVVLPEIEMYAPQPGLTGETGVVAAGTTDPEKTPEPEDRAATALPRRDPGEAEIVLPEIEMYPPQLALAEVTAGTAEPEDRTATALPRRDPGEAGIVLPEIEMYAAGTAEPEDQAATALLRRDPGEAEIVLPEIEMYAPQPGLTGGSGRVVAGRTEPEDRAATALPRRDPGEAEIVLRSPEIEIDAPLPEIHSPFPAVAEGTSVIEAGTIDPAKTPEPEDRAATALPRRDPGEAGIGLPSPDILDAIESELIPSVEDAFGMGDGEPLPFGPMLDEPGYVISERSMDKGIPADKANTTALLGDPAVIDDLTLGEPGFIIIEEDASADEAEMIVSVREPAGIENDLDDESIYTGDADTDTLWDGPTIDSALSEPGYPVTAKTTVDAAGDDRYFNDGTGLIEPGYTVAEAKGESRFPYARPDEPVLPDLSEPGLVIPELFEDPFDNPDPSVTEIDAGGAGDNELFSLGEPEFATTPSVTEIDAGGAGDNELFSFGEPEFATTAGTTADATGDDGYIGNGDSFEFDDGTGLVEPDYTVTEDEEESSFPHAQPSVLPGPGEPSHLSETQKNPPEQGKLITDELDYRFGIGDGGEFPLETPPPVTEVSQDSPEYLSGPLPPSERTDFSVNEPLVNIVENIKMVEWEEASSVSTPPVRNQEETALSVMIDTPAGLERGKYYVQIGGYTNTDRMEAIVRELSPEYPLTVMGNRYILIGPLNEGESNALKQQFRVRGYPNAFIVIGK
jgi:hypothetical protein